MLSKMLPAVVTCAECVSEGDLWNASRCKLRRHGNSAFSKSLITAPSLAATELDPPSVGSGDPVDTELTELLVCQTDALVKGLGLILEHHGAPGLRRDLSVQLHNYLDDAADQALWLKRAKHVLTAPMSAYLRNSPPPPPDRVWVPTGNLARWMRPRRVCYNRKNTHLWYSWLQAKRAALPLSEEIVLSTYEKHYATLSREDSGNDDVIDQIFGDETFRCVLERTRAKLHEHFSPKFLDLSGTSSACFENTRSWGGQHRHLVSCAKGKRGAPNHALILVHVEELETMKLRNRVWSRTGLRFNKVTSYYRPSGEEEWRSLPFEDSVGPIDAAIQAVLEPFKVRVISKGHARAYHCVRRIQRAMHTALREMDCFRLIGQPMSPDMLQDLRENTPKGVPLRWFSIDYSAATDGLSWKYSSRIFRFLIGGLPKPFYDQAMRVLGPHMLWYPDSTERPVWHRRGIQKNGQLMGSVLSFPILCLANLGVCLLNLSREQTFSDLTIDQRLRRFLINGDDGLYVSSESFWEGHIEVASAVGLEMSVGKAYHHRDYANINSTSISCDLSREDSTPWAIPFLNTGLIVGQHKVLGGVETEKSDRRYIPIDSRATSLARAHISQDPLNPVHCNIPTILEGSLPGRQVELMRVILRERKHDISKECRSVISSEEPLFAGKRVGIFSRNLFVSKGLGGMGVVPPIGWKTRVTSIDRIVAKASAERLKSVGLVGSPTYPLTGQEVQNVPTFCFPWAKPRVELEDGPLVQLKRQNEKSGYAAYRRMKSTSSLFVNWILSTECQSLSICRDLEEIAPRTLTKRQEVVLEITGIELMCLYEAHQPVMDVVQE